MAVDWMGNAPSADMAALLAVNTASNFAQFKSALAGWHAPTQNFVYADTAGNIGVIAPGYYPQVPAGCMPWLPMPGSGACDITGVIPYQAVPQSYDPPSHVIATDNQRPVGGDYPYYVGTAFDFYDPGYRAAHAYRELEAAEPLTASSIARLQNDLADPLAARVLPAVLSALSAGRRVRPGPAGGGAAALVERPDGRRVGRGVALVDVLGQLPQRRLRALVAGGEGPGERGPQRPRRVEPGLAPLDEDLEAWTLGDPSNAAFAGPSGDGPGTASTAIVAAFKEAVAHLSKSLAARRRRGPGDGCTAGRSRRSPGRPGSATARARRAATRSPRTRRTAASSRHRPELADDRLAVLPGGVHRARRATREASRRTRRRRGTPTWCRCGGTGSTCRSPCPVGRRADDLEPPWLAT